MPMREWVMTALNLADATPVNHRGIAVLLVARYDAALTSDTFRHVEMKPVLLSGSRHPFGNQRRALPRIRATREEWIVVEQIALKQGKARHAPALPSRRNDLRISRPAIQDTAPAGYTSYLGAI